MIKRVSTVAAGVVAVAALAAGSIQAAGIYKVSATLTSKAEVPAPKGAPHGKGTFTGSYKENATGAVLTWKLRFSGLTGPATAAHIHMGKPGVPGPVLVPLCGPCKNGQSGTAKISKAVIAALEAGRTYVNVHTAGNPGGEIRGQVKVSG